MAIEAAARADPITFRSGLLRAAQLLREAGIESASLDAEVLLRHVLAIEREHLYLNGDRLLGELERARFWALVKRRTRREPVAYITRNKEFWSLDLRVTPDVLIPRSETELLIEVSLQLAKTRDTSPDLRILDLGTGSGAIAISLAKELPNAAITGSDISIAALKVARMNAARHGLSRQIRFCHANLFKGVAAERDRFHLIVSNPPYIRSGELQLLSPDIRDWEPVTAIDGGTDGLDCYRRIAAEAHRCLAAGGYVALEIGVDMAADVSGIFTGTNCYAAPAIYQDYSGRDRVLVTRKLL